MSNFDNRFFNSTLDIKPDEVELFLEFCGADPNLKLIIEDTNVLIIMDYLTVNYFKLFPIGCKMLFFTNFLSFLNSVAMLCSKKKPSIEQKFSIFRFNQKSLNQFSKEY